MEQYLSKLAEEINSEDHKIRKRTLINVFKGASVPETINWVINLLRNTFNKGKFFPTAAVSPTFIKVDEIEMINKVLELFRLVANPISGGIKERFLILSCPKCKTYIKCRYGSPYYRYRRHMISSCNSELVPIKEEVTINYEYTRFVIKCGFSNQINNVFREAGIPLPIKEAINEVW